MNQNKIAWNFDNTYSKLPESFFTRLAPRKSLKPKLVIVNKSLAKALGLKLDRLTENELAEIFSGNQVPKGAEPIALAYAGHQFGYFTFLGDGRAHLLGEHTTSHGQHFDIQLKGSGQTPYGLRGDGRAALGPMLREYLISEAMHALKIPTTRSLAVVLTGEQVFREVPLPGAVLTRVASSHLRIGTFEYIAAKNDLANLKILADYAIQRHYPEALDTKNPYLYFLQAVIHRQVELIVHWMRVGFIHGVMNTDNMTISGETLDYGPCAFMDDYHHGTVFSSIDTQGRYAYANQPLIAQWNLARFAETLLPLLDKDRNKAVQMAEEAIRAFTPEYEKKWFAMMRTKLGLEGKQKEDSSLILDLLDWMDKESADYTNTFRALSVPNLLETPPFNTIKFQDWYQRWQTRLQHNGHSLKATYAQMQATNPAVIPRNHKVEEALNAAVRGCLRAYHSLLSVLAKPYKESKKAQVFQSPPSLDERVYQTFCGT